MNSSHRFTLTELADKLKLPAVGDKTRLVGKVLPPEEADAETLCVVWDAKTLKMTAPDIPILGKPEFFSEGRSGLVAENPRTLLPELLNLFAPPSPPLRGVHPAAFVASDARVSPDAWVGPMCTVESGAVVEARAQLAANVFVGKDVRIGEGSRIEPQVSLMRGVRIGKNCILHAGCAIGCDGFGFLPSSSGLVKIPQIGSVVVGNGVEVGACTTIDRGTMGDTVIGEGTKIDNYVQIGHNVRIGKNCIICSMSGIGGSSVVEDGVTVSVQVGITDHVRIGKGAVLAGRAGATNDISPGAVVSGFPARPHSEAKRAQVLGLRLPELFERLKRIERTLSGSEPGHRADPS